MEPGSSNEQGSATRRPRAKGLVAAALKGYFPPLKPSNGIQRPCPWAMRLHCFTFFQLCLASSMCCVRLAITVTIILMSRWIVTCPHSVSPRTCARQGRSGASAQTCTAAGVASEGDLSGFPNHPASFLSDSREATPCQPGLGRQTGKGTSQWRAWASCWDRSGPSVSRPVGGRWNRRERRRTGGPPASRALQEA